ncbi:MAG TPA: PDZ domain-containing protein, partial [Vicinamibacteria bacterium]|nr:PDZ domain-containing protein [Vicinamibacteria bacterium]
MSRPLKNALVVIAALALAAVGICNIVQKASWTMIDDGVFWRSAPQGLVAARVAAQGPAARAGLHAGDVLLAVDGEEVLSPERLEAALLAKGRGERVTYALLRADERRALSVTLQPLPQGNVAAFYYLSLAGFFSLVVGTVVMLRRPAERTSLHFYLVCVLFFLMYSTSYTGKLDAFDWLLVWTDHLATLFLPVVFLHFCFSFPERRIASARRWLVPALYMPAFLLTGAAAMSQALFARGEQPAGLWGVVEAIDAAKPLYFASLFAVSFGVLLHSYNRARSLTARRQVKWLVWGTAAGAFPFLAFYALPFALGREPGLAMQLVGYAPLALVPLSLAYAVVKHRLMDVELIFRRSLGYVLAVAVIVGLALLTEGLTDVLWEEPHATLITLLSALVVVVLFTPLKARIQEALERLSYKGRYSSRKALVRLSEDLNADLDLERTCERLLEGIGAALGIAEMVVFLPGEDQSFAPFRARGLPKPAFGLQLRASGLLQRLSAGQPVDLDSTPVEHRELAACGLAWLLPCRVKGEVIAVLGVGRKEGSEPLNSEEVDVLKALAAQAASAILNGRLFRSLSEKAEELRGLKEYNENILESLDSGIVVLDLEGRVVRWNRAMEALLARARQEVLGRPLDAVFPEAFLEAMRG